MNILTRSKINLDPELYEIADPGPLVLGWTDPNPPQDRQYILRMLVRSEGWICIPWELDWLRHHIMLSMEHQNKFFGNMLPFLYVTVRHGHVSSETDDAWHVDGFSMRVPHVPERNYSWASSYPTEFVDTRVRLSQKFDPLRHNIHTYFQEFLHPSVRTWAPSGWVLFDPYCIHRRPPGSGGVWRTFVRISATPIPIRDGRNTPNPSLDVPTYGTRDFRETLTRFTL